jgi:pyruvyltransferase
MIDVYRWNPRRPLRDWPGVRRFPVPVNNFGDLLGPLIVAGMMQRLGLGEPSRAGQLMSVGSVLHLARGGAVVWGSGINGKMPLDHIPDDLDIRAVRGPRTAAVLRARGHSVPDVFGDPALLLPMLRPDLAAKRRRWDVTIVPNLNDRSAYRGRRVLHPRLPLRWCLYQITASRLVVGSSLHGVIVAEAFGIPARLIWSQREDEFKYRDYYEATGRPDFQPADSVAEAIARGGEVPPIFDPEPLIDAFPRELWQQTALPTGRP